MILLHKKILPERSKQEEWDGEASDTYEEKTNAQRALVGKTQGKEIAWENEA